LIGFQNRFLVLSNWFYSYLSRDRHARLIIKTKSEKSDNYSKTSIQKQTSAKTQ